MKKAPRLTQIEIDAVNLKTNLAKQCEDIAQAQLDADHEYYQKEAEKLQVDADIRIETYAAALADQIKITAQTRQDTIREIKEWGNEFCNEHLPFRGKRRACPECWQSLGEKK